jgi:hypothetical protein
MSEVWRNMFWKSDVQYSCLGLCLMLGFRECSVICMSIIELLRQCLASLERLLPRECDNRQN